MSLGIIAKWRVRPLRLGPSIPRECLFFVPPRPSRPAPFTSSAAPRGSVSTERELTHRFLGDDARTKVRRVAASGEPADYSHEAILDDDTEMFFKGDSGESHGDIEPSLPDDQEQSAWDDIRTIEEALTRDQHANEKTRKRPEKDRPSHEEQDETALEEVRKMEEALERGHFMNSVLVKPSRKYPHAAETRESRRRHHQSISAQVRHDRTRQKQDYLPSDWRKILEMMAQSTPEQSLQWIEDGMRIDVPKHVLTAILDDVGDDKIGAIRLRTGATMKVARDDSTILVSGNRQAINMATEEFRRIARSITITRLYSPLEPGEEPVESMGGDELFFEPPLSREEGASFHRRKIREHLYTTPMPLVWSPKTLENYVVHLVDSVVAPTHLQSEIYRPVKRELLSDHERAIARRVQRVFTNTEAQSAASCSALKLALSFLAQKGEKYLPEVRHVFVVMDRRGIKMDAEVFNILLRAAVKARNMRNFLLTLRNMIRRGFAPNLETWLLFFRMFESMEVRSMILQTMHAKGLLAIPDTIHRVAREMASMDAEYAVHRGLSLNAFLEEQKDRYGPEWLTTDSANRVLDVLSRHGRFQDAFALLDLMAARKSQKTGVAHPAPASRVVARPDHVSFNTIMSHAKTQGKMPVAVNLLRKMKTAGLSSQPSATILHLLFEMAWKMRLRATIVVVWRFSCLARLTSWRMRDRVARLLVQEFGADTRKKLAPAAYRKLGGQALARELVGGSAALEKLGESLQKIWGSNAYPHGDGSVLAAKALACAFQDFGPAIALGEVLAESVILDTKCLRAQKDGQLLDVLRRARAKSLPLWRKKQPEEETWVDVAPRVWAKPSRIGPFDVWDDLLEEDLWSRPPRDLEPDGGNVDPRFGAASTPSGTLLAAADQPDQEQTGDHKMSSLRNDEDGHRSQARRGGVHGESDPDHERAVDTATPETLKYMAIINPRLWADGVDENAGLWDTDRMAELRMQNERAIVDAMDVVRNEKIAFRPVFPEDIELDEHGAEMKATSSEAAGGEGMGTDGLPQGTPEALRPGMTEETAQDQHEQQRAGASKSKGSESA